MLRPPGGRQWETETHGHPVCAQSPSLPPLPWDPSLRCSAHCSAYNPPNPRSWSLLNEVRPWRNTRWCSGLKERGPTACTMRPGRWGAGAREGLWSEGLQGHQGSSGPGTGLHFCSLLLLSPAPALLTVFFSPVLPRIKRNFKPPKSLLPKVRSTDQQCQSLLEMQNC